MVSDALIHVLSEEVANQIAAGEVAERPSAVVKELLENAIDAGAKRIDIEIKEGGQKLIEVTDDGVGMSAQDVALAFNRHATSKIRVEEDLHHLQTLGFRGEALASISAVSRTTIISRREQDEMGSLATVEGGQVRAAESISHARGTRVQVKNLFYNVPARRKFLKSQQAEMSAIADMVCHYMLGYPELAFRLMRNNVPLTCSPGTGDLLDAVLAIYGPEDVRTLLPLKSPESLSGTGLSVRGFISPPNAAKKAARYQTTLVNRRAVKSKLLAQAINKALSPFFPRGTFPLLVFDLRLPAGMVDVNVHPQKTEVRFADERWIFGIVLETLQTSLSGLKLVQIAPEEMAPVALWPAEPEVPGSTPTSTEVSPPPAETSLFAKISRNHPIGENSGNPLSGIPVAPSGVGGLPSSPPSPRLYELRESQERLGPGVSPLTGLESVIALSEPRILCQCFNSYLLGEDRDGLFLVDQHAAHERILFDTYLDAYREEKVNSQSLLFPVPLRLLPSERVLIREKGSELKCLGFSIQEEDDGQFYALAVPILDGKSVDTEVIQDLLSQLLSDWEGRTLTERKVDLFKTMACKAAVKAGDFLKEPEMRSLFEQLLKTRNPFTCPHGRPTVVRLTKRQIEHGFLRV